MGKSEKKTYNDEALSKNFGANIRYRKRLIEEKEARAIWEDGLKEINEQEAKDFDGPYLRGPQSL